MRNNPRFGQSQAQVPAASSAAPRSTDTALSARSQRYAVPAAAGPLPPCSLRLPAALRLFGRQSRYWENPQEEPPAAFNRLPQASF